MWLFEKLRAARDWLFIQLVASAATQIQTAFLNDAADCAVDLEAKAKQLDELGLKSQSAELRRHMPALFAATPPTAPTKLADSDTDPMAALTKPRRTLKQGDS